MGILIFLLAITVVIAIHEYGHYLACRLMGIPVQKFAVGVGKPLLTKTDRHGTEWSIRPFPIGGFILPEQKAMSEARPLAKFIVAIAGPMANLLPFMVLAAAFGKFTVLMKFLAELYVGGIVAIFNVLTFNLFATPQPQTAEGAQVMGPIGIAASTMEITPEIGAGMTFLFLFTVISIGIALINLIPIPLFDGGRAVLAGVEAGIGRDRAARVEKVTNRIGIVIIVMLFLIITTQDILNLF